MLAVFVISTYIASYYFKSRIAYLLLLKFYTVCEYSIFALFLNAIIKNPLVKSILKFSIPVFIIFALSYYFIISPKIFSTYPSIVEFLLFIIFIIYFFYEKMQTVVMYPLYQSITFWICVAFFIYFTGNFFFFLFSNTTKDPNFIKQLLIIYGIVTITKNILLCCALLASEPVEENDEVLNIPTDINLDDFTLTNAKNQ